MLDSPDRDKKSAQQLEWTDENISKFWDYYARFPETYFTQQYGKSIVKSLSKYLRRDGLILDYGCGPGGLLSALLERGYQAAGADVSLESIRQVDERFSHEPNFLGAFTVEGIHQKDYRFDTVLLIETVEHLNDQKLSEVLTLSKTLLQDDGFLVVTTPNEEDLSNSVVYCPQCEHEFHRWQHVRSWSQKSLKLSLEHSGFQVAHSCTRDFSMPGGISLLKNPVQLARHVRQSLTGARPHLLCVCRLKQD